MIFNNTFNLAKHILKREWKIALIWLVILAGISLAVAGVFQDLYGTAVERIVMAETMSNPAMIAMIGPVYGLDNYTNGVMYAQMMLLFSILAVAAMNIFLVVRHTRKDEESGRIELIRSLPVGRLSYLGGTVIVCLIVNVLLALITGFGLYSLNLESMDFAGSLAYGVALGVSGIFFGAIAALFVQASSTSRGAISYSFIFLGAAYIIRAIGDVSAPALSYISPLGIVLKTETYASNYIWPIIVLITLSAIVFIFAFYLNSIRDLGAGLIAAKPGKSEASKFLQTPFGLSLRLLKGTIIGWAVTMFILGISYGTVFGDIENFLSGSELMQQIFLGNDAFSFAEQFLSTLMVISALLITIPTLIVLLKLRGEEKKGRLENIYAKKVSRNTMLTNYLFLSFVTSILMTILFIFGLWGAAYASMEEPISFMIVFKAGMSYLPAIWLMIAGAVVLISFIPKRTNFIWVLLGAFFYISYIGKIMGIPDSVINATPFGAIPKIPVENLSWIPLVILTAISIVMIVVGFFGYNERDMKQN